MAGILAGVGLAFLLEHLRHTIRTPDQVAEHLELPVLGLIPKVAKP
jgi:capsular polysaccharide biosynthesis protein